MRLIDCFIIVMTTMFLCGTYIVFRLRALKYAFKNSNEKTFLDFFEKEFLKSEERTWRWKYSFFYNSKMYFICWKVICFICYLVVVLGAVTLIVIYKLGYWQILRG